MWSCSQLHWTEYGSSTRSYSIEIHRKWNRCVFSHSFIAPNLWRWCVKWTRLVKNENARDAAWKMNKSCRSWTSVNIYIRQILFTIMPNNARQQGNSVCSSTLTVNTALSGSLSNEEHLCILGMWNGTWCLLLYGERFVILSVAVTAELFCCESGRTMTKNCKRKMKTTIANIQLKLKLNYVQTHLSWYLRPNIWFIFWSLMVALYSNCFQCYDGLRIPMLKNIYFEVNADLFNSILW